jgi:hypothetical protein
MQFRRPHSEHEPFSVATWDRRMFAQPPKNLRGTVIGWDIGWALRSQREPAGAGFCSNGRFGDSSSALRLATMDGPRRSHWRTSVQCISRSGIRVFVAASRAWIKSEAFRVLVSVSRYPGASPFRPRQYHFHQTSTIFITCRYCAGTP